VSVDAATGMAHYQRGELHRIRGESRDAERAYREALAAGQDPQPGLALLRAAQGRADSAKLALQRALAESRTDFVRIRLLPAMVDVSLAAGDVAAAQTAATGLAATADRLDTPYLQAVRAQCDGAIALASGQPAEAVGTLRAALNSWAAVGAPYEAARCRILLARACRLLGDVETAKLETATAREVLAALGARHDLSVLDADAMGRPSAPDGLTPREVEVLRLLATGQSNREIAEGFVLSERTVARHVANIFVKIGVNSRAAAAATAYAYDTHLI
jgi:DNA-binding NarL/FixJ family response regulator